MPVTYLIRNKLILFLLLVTVIKGIVWSSIVPIWHFPDEQAHFAQISSFVETGKMPPHPELGNDVSYEILISQRLLGTERDWAGINKFTYNPQYNIEYTDSTIGLSEEKISSLPKETRLMMEKKEAAAYPPLYYFLTAFGYKLAYDKDLFTRVIVVRLANLFFLIALVVFSYKFFRIIFAGKELFAVTSALLVAFHPMLTFVSSGINSDNLFNLLFTIGIYFSAILLFERLTLSKLLAIIILLFLSIKTKPQGVLLIYVFLFPLIFQLIKGKLAKGYSLSGSVLLFGYGAKIILEHLQGRQVIPEVNLYDLRRPDLTLLDHLKWTIKHTIAEVIPWYWGVFKWLGVVLPRTVNRIINRVMLASLLGLVLSLFRSLKTQNYSQLLVLVFLFYVAVGYFLAITLFDYLFIRHQGFSIGVQGRYFFPTISVHMGLLLWGLVSLTPVRFSHIVAKLTGVGMFFLNFIALYTVTASYYDIVSVKIFFIQASQYKPWFAKSPFLEVYSLLYGIVAVIFIYQYLSLRVKVKNYVKD